jgi:predicted site-specific integrase-resolvase
MQLLFIRRQEAAKMLGVTPRTLSRWHKLGRLKMVRITPRVLGYHPEDLEKFARGNTQGGEEEGK